MQLVLQMHPLRTEWHKYRSEGCVRPSGAWGACMHARMRNVTQVGPIPSSAGGGLDTGSNGWRVTHHVVGRSSTWVVERRTGSEHEREKPVTDNVKCVAREMGGESDSGRVGISTYIVPTKISLMLDVLQRHLATFLIRPHRASTKIHLNGQIISSL
jgi:hypothetical protein